MEPIDVSKEGVYQFACDGSFTVITYHGETFIVPATVCFTNNTDSPVYQHDCAQCVFLGKSWDDRSKKNYDLYYCEKEPTVIARYGDEGAAYFSGLEWTANEHLSKALGVAKKLGLHK